MPYLYQGLKNGKCELFECLWREPSRHGPRSLPPRFMLFALERTVTHKYTVRLSEIWELVYCTAAIARLVLALPRWAKTSNLPHAQDDYEGTYDTSVSCSEPCLRCVLC